MRRLLVVLLTSLFATGSMVSAIGAPTAQANHLPGKTIVLLGSIGRNLGETPWDNFRQQLTMRGFPDSEILEFQYAGGTFGPDGAWNPNAGGMCESFSKTSFLALRQMMADLKANRPTNEVFLVGHGIGGFVATQALWAVMGGVEDPATWENLSGIISISGPMAGVNGRRAAVEFTQAATSGCADPSMVAWLAEVGDTPDRFAIAEQRGTAATALGYKIGSFGNTVDCAYRYTSPDICPQLTEAAGGQALLLRALGDERQTMFIKTGTLWKEYNETQPYPGDFADNHSALLLKTQPMAEIAEFVMSQTR
ncbi:MAG: hypothetical protein IT305_21500 [Chloroflexi bacterium]|nr:hypothetical protein [Chloroflexota bacterium]